MVYRGLLFIEERGLIMAYASVFKCKNGEQLLVNFNNGQFALYSEKSTAVAELNRIIKETDYELDGSSAQYRSILSGYHTVRSEVSEERKEQLLQLKNTIEIKQPSALHFKDGTKLKGSK